MTAPPAFTVKDPSLVKLPSRVTAALPLPFPRLTVPSLTKVASIVSALAPPGLYSMVPVLVSVTSLVSISAALPIAAIVPALVDDVVKSIAPPLSRSIVCPDDRLPVTSVGPSLAKTLKVEDPVPVKFRKESSSTMPVPLVVPSS